MAEFATVICVHPDGTEHPSTPDADGMHTLSGDCVVLAKGEVEWVEIGLRRCTD